MDRQALAHLIDEVGQPGFHAALHEVLAGVVDFRNFIVMRFEAGRTAELLHTNLPVGTLLRQMAPYMNGLYGLDPYVVAAEAGDGRLFAAMDEVAPEGFGQSDFFQKFYKYVDVTDGVRFICPLGGGRFIHVFLEREPPEPEFSAEERDRFRALGGVVCSLLRKHNEWTVMVEGAGATKSRPLRCDLREVIAGLRDGALTRREVEIIELLLQGHSSKSIGARLSISEGTVTNHKRNIYEKLGIHSQAQLFNLFIEALAGMGFLPEGETAA